MMTQKIMHITFTPLPAPNHVVIACNKDYPYVEIVILGTTDTPHSRMCMCYFFRTVKFCKGIK